jgi:hypothetical protein
VAKQSGATMSQVVEADLSHPFILQQLPEIIGNPTRPDEVSVLKDIDVFIEIVIITVSEEFLHFVLFHLHFQKFIGNEIAKWKSPKGALVFG